MADKLLDFSQPFDVPLLDATIGTFYGTGSKEEVKKIVFGVRRVCAAAVHVVAVSGHSACG